jgi:hypothetical protein
VAVGLELRVACRQSELGLTEKESFEGFSRWLGGWRIDCQGAVSQALALADTSHHHSVQAQSELPTQAR